MNNNVSFMNILYFNNFYFIVMFAQFRENNSFFGIQKNVLHLLTLIRLNITNKK